MNILILGPERSAIKSFISSIGDTVRFTEDKLTANSKQVEWSDFLISYGYRYIVKTDVLDLFPQKAINLHISYLPWNRGADPNLWSFLDDTPKGVTIHYLEKGLDTGAILAQKEIVHHPDDTLRTSYERLAEIIELLFIQVWPDIRAGRQKAIPQPQGGTSHRLRDSKAYEQLLTQAWDTPVADLIGIAKTTKAGRAVIKKNEIKVGDRIIGRDHPPFIIAEMSGNHNQSLDRALEIVEAAARAGAHALKIQTYTAETMTLDMEGNGFSIDDPDSLWNGTTLYKLYQQAYTPWEWHQPIFDRCRELGIIGFSTPFDDTAVDFLESLKTPAYKIASFENTDLPLIRRVAATGKPMIISTGMATQAELDETVRTVREAGCHDLVLLKCTSSYPATPEESHLRTLPHMRDHFNVEVGLSDHTLGIGAALAGISLGATVIEKHFTLCRADGGVDSAFSLEPDEMKSLVEESLRGWQALGEIRYGQTKGEKKSLQFRRSLYVTRDMDAGEEFSKDNFRAIRPGFGLSPKYYETFLGKRAGKNIKKGTPLSWDLLSDKG